MKEKIINALATKYSNLGVGKKALDGVAAFIEKNVTTEEDIENAIAGSEVLTLLKAIQGESDTLRNEKALLKKQLEELKGKTNPNPEPTPKGNPDSEVAKLLKEIKERQDAADKKFADYEAKVRHDSLLKEAEELMKKNGSTNNFIRSLAIKGLEVGETDTAATLAERGKAAYDSNFKEAYGESPVPPRGSGNAGEGYKKGMFADFAKRLEASGKLPKSNE